jgi:hypothetical protein
MGTPAFSAIARAATLLPNARICDDFGPMKVIPYFSQPFAFFASSSVLLAHGVSQARWCDGLQQERRLDSLRSADFA